MVSQPQSPRALINSVEMPDWYANDAPPLQKESPAYALGSSPSIGKWQPRSQDLSLPAPKSERPWSGLVTCVPKSGTWQINVWWEEPMSVNFVST